jgi:hypothetical protein
MAYNLAQVVSYGFPLDQFTFTYLLATAVTEDNVGHAVTLDTSAASKFKLAGNGNPIHGRLFSFENDTVLGVRKGAVERKFKQKLPAIAAHGIVVGDSVCGSATPGTVRKAIPGTDPITNLVVEVIGNEVVVESL